MRSRTRQPNSVAFVNLPAGRYVFIVKAQAGRAGSINLRFSAFSGRRVEICGNNIDDDTNGLIDCADTACFGVVGCPAPACVPDIDVGSFASGTSRTVMMDTRAGGTLYPTTCSRGTGRERVLRLTLTQMMSLAHDCTDTGSHVFQLSRQLQPLDACNGTQPRVRRPGRVAVRLRLLAARAAARGVQPDRAGVPGGQ